MVGSRIPWGGCFAVDSLCWAKIIRGCTCYLEPVLYDAGARCDFLWISSLEILGWTYTCRRSLDKLTSLDNCLKGIFYSVTGSLYIPVFVKHGFYCQKNLKRFWRAGNYNLILASTFPENVRNLSMELSYYTSFYSKRLIKLLNFL